MVNGIERVVRMLIQPRRHYIMALRRSAYRKRGSSYTDMATVLRCAPACARSRCPRIRSSTGLSSCMQPSSAASARGHHLDRDPCMFDLRCRCVRPDEVSSTVRCHFMTTGKITFTFSVRRRELFLPASVLLKCFLDASDRELFHYLVDCSPTVSRCSRCPARVVRRRRPAGRSARGALLSAYSLAMLANGLPRLTPPVVQRNAKEETTVLEAAEAFIKEPSRLGLHSRLTAVAYVGRSFRSAIQVPEDMDDLEVGPLPGRAPRSFLRP